VEKVNRTLQDQLIKELRLTGICDFEGGNRSLARFMSRSNVRFAVVPRRAENQDLTLRVSPERPRDIPCNREQRYVGQQFSLSYDRQRIMLIRIGDAESANGQHAYIYKFADGWLEVR
jgi:hypothetical protein